MEGGSVMVKFGKTEINREAALAMGKEEFKKTFRGKLSTDLDKAWDRIEGKAPAEPAEETPKPNRRGGNKKPEASSEEK